MRPGEVSEFVMLLAAILAGPAWPGHAEGPGRPNVVVIIADDMAWDDCGAFGNPGVRTPEYRQAGPGGHAVRPGLRHGQLVQPEPGQPPDRTLPARRRRRGAALAAAGRAGHLRRGAQGVRLLDRRRRASGTWATPPKSRFDLVREADPSGFQTGDRPGRRGPDDRPGLGRRPERLRPVGGRAPGPARRTGPSSSGWPPSTRTGITRGGPPPAAPARGGRRSLPACPTCPRSARTWHSITTRSAGSTATSATSWRSWTARASAGATLVLFLSDNGRPFPRSKTTLYDGGIRTPLIARWPGHIQPGGRCGGLVSTVDLAPTILKLAGVEPGPTFQGKDLSPLFADPDGEGPRDDLRRAELARLRLPRPGGPVGAVQVHPERRRATAPDAPRRRGPEPDLPGDAPAPGRGQADPAAAVLLREPQARRGTLRPGRRPRRGGQPGRGPEVRRGPGRDEAGVVGVGDGRRTTRCPPEASPDEFDRETGEPLPGRVRPRPGKDALRNPGGPSRR